jgi:signal peptidase I
VTAAPRRGRRAALAALALAVGALLLVGRALVAEPFRIPSGSMEPTLHPGDSVLVTKLAFTPRRRQLVVFHRPGSGEIMVKRVVAVGGDTVGLEDGVLVVDGRRVREAYADPDAIDSVFFGPVKVPPGTVFVMGDNRADAEDSRDFGAVPEADLVGRAVARVWPPGRWGAAG